MTEPNETPQERGRPVFLQFPPDYDELSEDDRLAVCRGMAIELQRQLGIVSKPAGSAGQDPGPRLDPAEGPPGEALLGIYASDEDLAELEDGADDDELR